MLERLSIPPRSAVSLADAIHEPMVLSRPGGELVHLNPASERLFGWAARDLAGFPAVTLLPPGRTLPAADEREPWIPTTARRRDGTTLDVEIARSPVVVDGEPLVVWSIREPRDERGSEEQLHILAMALRFSATGTELTDADARILWVNHAFTELTGWPREEIVGKTPRVLRPAGADESRYDEIMEHIQAGNVWRGELVRRRRDGSLYDASVTVSPIFDRGGKLTHLIAHHEDVTARNRELEALSRSEARQREKIEDVVRVLDDPAADAEAKLARIRAAIAD